MRSPTLQLGKWPGFLAVMLALVSLLAQACLALPAESPETQWAALEAASVFCQTGHPPDGGERPVPHRAADYALCPLGVALALPAAILSPDPLVPTPCQVSEPARYERPPGRAPPSTVVAAAYPRGPPRLV